jgi:xanthine dehydrogenase YagS FAD-binding subunit
MLTRATTLEEVRSAVGEIRAGGTDVQERYRTGVSAGPLIDISRLADSRTIHWTEDGAATLGTLVSLHTIATDPRIRAAYSGLAKAAGEVATPQIRLMGTLGGTLLQRTRCWYFRNPSFRCYKRGGESCPAREGNHSSGVIFDLGPCVFPHPSTLGMALLAYEAQVKISGHELRPVAALYGDGSDPTRDHTLGANELLTRIVLPPPLQSERTAYVRAISRAQAEWPLVEALVRLVIDDGVITTARVGVGGVANIPLRLANVENALRGQPATGTTFENVAQRASEDATPLPMTQYKVKLLCGTVYEALQRAASQV